MPTRKIRLKQLKKTTKQNKTKEGWERNTTKTISIFQVNFITIIIIIITTTTTTSITTNYTTTTTTTTTTTSTTNNNNTANNNNLGYRINRGVGIV